MSIDIHATAKLSKTFRVAREKLDDDTEQVIAHLRVSDIMIDRDQLDKLCGQPIGWSASALFDDFGAPLARLTIGLDQHRLTLSGVIDGGKRPVDPVLKLKDADVSSISLGLTKLGALLSCQLSWHAACDEVDDIAEMLGRLCNIAIVIQNGGQGDLIDSVRTMQRMADDSGTVTAISAPGGESVVFAPSRGRITKFNEAIQHEFAAAAQSVVSASAALTLHSDGRAYFDSGTATEQFRAALSGLRARLEDVT